MHFLLLNYGVLNLLWHMNLFLAGVLSLGTLWIPVLTKRDFMISLILLHDIPCKVG